MSTINIPCWTVKILKMYGRGNYKSDSTVREKTILEATGFRLYTKVLNILLKIILFRKLTWKSVMTATLLIWSLSLLMKNRVQIYLHVSLSLSLQVFYFTSLSLISTISWKELKSMIVSIASRSFVKMFSAIRNDFPIKYLQ